jgi:hypothetical protein
MKITYSNISGLFRATRNWAKVQKLTNADGFDRSNENSEQEDAYQESDLGPVYTHRYNMRDHVTISITNASIV